MKKWNKAEMQELELKCTENGRDITPYKDEVRIETPEINFYSFSGVSGTDLPE